jgi:hypothetical protein
MSCPGVRELPRTKAAFTRSASRLGTRTAGQTWTRGRSATTYEPGPKLDPEDQVFGGRELLELSDIDGLDVAVAGRTDRPGFPVEVGRNTRVTRPRRLARRHGVEVVREDVVDVSHQFFPHARDDVVRLDRKGDVMDEVDQDPYAHHREQDAHRHREVRHEDGLFRAPDGAEHEQAVEEGGHEGAEHDLVRRIAHEVAEQPRTQLGGSERERDQRHGEDHAGDGDHGTRDGPEDRARSLGATRVREAEGIGPLVRLRPVDRDHSERQRDGGACHEAGDEPEAGANQLPVLEQLRHEGRLCDAATG